MHEEGSPGCVCRDGEQVQLDTVPERPSEAKGRIWQQLGLEEKLPSSAGCKRAGGGDKAPRAGAGKVRAWRGLWWLWVLGSPWESLEQRCWGPARGQRCFLRIFVPSCLLQVNVTS